MNISASVRFARSGLTDWLCPAYRNPPPLIMGAEALRCHFRLEKKGPAISQILVHLHIRSAHAGAVTEHALIRLSLVMLAEVVSALERYFMCCIHVNPTEFFLYLRLTAFLPIWLLRTLLHPFSLRRASKRSYKSGVSGRPCCVFCTCAGFPGSRSELFDVCVRTGEMQNGQHNNSCCSLL